MGSRSNFAPRLPTILVGVALTIIGVLGTFAGVLPDVAGMTSEVIGVWSFLAAAIVLMAGIIFKGI